MKFLKEFGVLFLCSVALSYGAASFAGALIEPGNNSSGGASSIAALGADGGNGITSIPNLAVGGGLVTALDCDLTAQNNFTFADGGNNTYCGITGVGGLNIGSGSTVVSTKGTGLVCTPVSATDWNGGTFTVPALAIPLANVIPNWNPSRPLQISAQITLTNAASNFSAAEFGIWNGQATAVGSGESAVHMTNGIDTALSIGIGWIYQVDLINSRVAFGGIHGAPFNTYSFGMIDLPSGLPTLTYNFYMGNPWNADGGWPMNSMQALAYSSQGVGTGSINTYTWWPNSVQPMILLGCVRAGSADALVVTYTRLQAAYR